MKSNCERAQTRFVVRCPFSSFRSPKTSRNHFQPRSVHQVLEHYKILNLSYIYIQIKLILHIFQLGPLFHYYLNILYFTIYPIKPKSDFTNIVEGPPTTIIYYQPQWF